MRHNFKFTIFACYIAYLTQALVINFTPLLYVTFQTELGLTLSQISLLIAVNFGTQMLTDLCSSPIVERIGHRAAVVLAHICCSAGMIGLYVCPTVMRNDFLAIMIPTVICGVGGGLIEVGCPDYELLFVRIVPFAGIRLALTARQTEIVNCRLGGKCFESPS